MKTRETMSVDRPAMHAAPVACLDRRALLKGAAAAGVLTAFPLVAHAEPAGSAGSTVPGGSANTAAGASVASDDAVVTALNEVAYPEPIASDDYETLWETLDANELDDAFVEALAAFANDLACYGIGQQEPDDEHPNVCLSPASLYFALALLAQGAGPGSQTAEQLLGALRADDAPALAEDCARLMRLLWARTTPDGDERTCTMQVANSVWMRGDVPFEQEFLDAATESFYADCFGVNGLDGDWAQVQQNLRQAAAQMGAWVAEHTGGTLEPSFELDDNWIAALINTVWLKDAWVNAFNENDTAPDVFHAASGDVTCDFMTQVDECDIVRSAGFSAAQLGLASGATLTFVLPDEDADARAMLGRATGVGKLFAMEAAEYARVTFVVPKLSFDTKVKLTQVCEAMGVTDAFGDAADLSALTPVEARVSSVEQGTHFAMDEEGVEASAYTAIMIETMAMLPQELEEVEFRLDRPFLFRLTSPDGVVLFDGLVADPTVA